MKTLSFYKNNRASIFIILLMLVSMIFSFYGCNKITEPINENTNISKLDRTQDENYETIKVIAKGLAVFLQQKNNRQIFRELLDNSKYTENIIESSEFLIQDNYKDNIASLLSSKEKFLFLEKVIEVEFGQYDIYFPLAEWRDNWKSSDKLLIAAVGFRNESDESDILAFDLQGSEIYLSSNETPLTPTLVVYPSEKHRSKNYPNNSILNKQNKRSKLMVQSNYESSCDSYYIEEDFDSYWWLGDMEIYFKVKWSYLGSNTWSSWQNIEMDYNTEADNWTTVNKTLVSQPGNFEMQIEVWEEDDSSPDDLVASYAWDNYTNIPCTITPIRLRKESTYNTYVDITGHFPPPLSVSISGPSVLYGSNTSNTKKDEIVIDEYSESATGTWTAYATGGIGSYSYAWHYRTSPTGGWSNTGATSQSYTRTIYNYIELKCEVTSGTETAYAIKTVTYVPAGIE